MIIILLVNFCNIFQSPEAIALHSEILRVFTADFYHSNLLFNCYKLGANITIRRLLTCIDNALCYSKELHAHP